MAGVISFCLLCRRFNPSTVCLFTTTSKHMLTMLKRTAIEFAYSALKPRVPCIRSQLLHVCISTFLAPKNTSRRTHKYEVVGPAPFVLYMPSYDTLSGLATTRIPPSSLGDHRADRKLSERGRVKCVSGTGRNQVPPIRSVYEPRRARSQRPSDH